MELESHPGRNCGGDSYIIRTSSEADIERAAQICQDAFGAFYASYGESNSFPPRERDDLVKRVVSFQVNHPSVSHFSAVSVNENGDEVEVIGSNGLDHRDPVAGVGPLSVVATSQTRGVGRALLKAVVDVSENVACARTTCLLVAGLNNRAFSLYASQGFKVVEYCTRMEGLASDEEESKALQAVEGRGVRVRKMEPGDAESCDRLFQRTFGFSRMNGIREQQACSEGDVGAVATRASSTGGEEVVGYATKLHVGGHCLAETPEVMEAILAYGSRLLKSTGASSSLAFHIIARRDPSVLAWALNAGIRVKRQFVWMYRGEPIRFREDYVYSPDHFY